MLRALRRLEHGRGIEEVLTLAVGKDAARHVVDMARRVVIRDIATPEGRPSERDSRRAIFAPEPVHPEDAPHIRRMVGVLLSILSWLGPSGRTGHEKQGHWLNVKRLGAIHGISDDEVTRYITVLRDAGILGRWQPPKGKGFQAGPSGHRYNLYHLMGGLPKELEKQLRRYHWRWWPRARDELTPAARAAKEHFETCKAIDDDAVAQAAMAFVESLRPP